MTWALDVMQEALQGALVARSGQPSLQKTEWPSPATRPHLLPRYSSQHPRPSLNSLSPAPCPP